MSASDWLISIVIVVVMWTVVSTAAWYIYPSEYVSATGAVLGIVLGCYISWRRVHPR